MKLTSRRIWRGRTRVWVQALIACYVLFALSTAAAQQPSTTPASSPARALFQKAQHQEDATGDIRAAIESYRKVLTVAPDRPLAARTLLRISECHRKLAEHDESRRALELVVRDYADQPAAIAEARTRLAAQKAALPSGTGLEQNQLWRGSDIQGDAAISPDARYLVYSSWAENGNLLLKDLSTGVVRPITKDAALRTSGRPQPWGPVFSPDGTRIVYAWYGKDQGSLRMSDRDGSNMRVLSSDANVDFPYAWSPDGRLIALNLYSAGQSRIALASVSKGAIEPLVSTAWQKAKVGGFSPDGRFLVYALAAAADEPGGIFTIAVDGGSKTKIADGKSPAWTPNGRAVVFISERSGSSDLWMVQVNDGRPNGTATLLKREVAAGFLRFTRDGSLFYGIRNLGRDIYTTKLDPMAARADAPALLTEVFVGSNGGASWSHDGTHVAFVRGADRRTMRVVVRNVASGQERVVPTKLDDGLNAQTRGVRWFPDNRSVLARDQASFKKIDIETGAQQVVALFALGSAGAHFDLSPDGRFLYFVRRQGEGVPPRPPVRESLMRRDIVTGAESELLPDVGAVRGLVVSPDGTQLAVRSQARGLFLLPIAGGAPIELQKTGSATLEPVAWTRDGRHILGVTVRVVKDGDELWAIPASGGAAVKFDIFQPPPNISTVSVSRTDGTLAISLRRPSEELWLVRNLLQPAPTR